MSNASNIREIYCTNVIASGSGFAIDTETGDVVYIPVSVTRMSGIEVGDTTMARLVPNTNAKSSSTPLMAIQIISDAQGPRSEEQVPAAPTPAPTPIVYGRTRDEKEDAINDMGEAQLAERVEDILLGGGLWNQGTMFLHLFPGARRSNTLPAYNRVGYIMRRFFDRGSCSKVSFWRTGGQSRPSTEWYTCDVGTVSLRLEEDDV